MNWKLILALSMYGLFMAIGTVFFIPSKIEPLCWLIIFILCARSIAKNVENRYFQHGFMVSIVNALWMIIVHSALSAQYIAHHTVESKQYQKMSAQYGLTIIQSMLIMEPIQGILAGLVLGLFAFIASRFIS